MSGKGPGAGFDFQSRLNAYVAAHILARQPLRWTRLSTGDVPTSVQSEGGGSGDDLRIELAGSTTVYECQSKRGLSADGRLDDAIDGFAAGLPAQPGERGLLIVDPRSSSPIRHDLADGLDAWRQGTSPTERGALKRVLDRLRAKGALAIASRLFVLTLDVERDVSAHALRGYDLLSRILDDPDQAGAAWAALVTDGLTLCREGGRRTYQDLVETLGKDNIVLSGGPGGTKQQLEHISQGVAATHASADQILAVVSQIVLPTRTPGTEPDAFTVRLDSAKGLLDAGDAGAALALLRSVRDAASDAAMSTVLRHRNLTAAALLHLGRIDEAKQELLTVLTFAPEDRVATLNLAQAEAMLGNEAEALRYADAIISRDPDEPNAWVIVIQCRPGVAVPDAVRDAAPVLTALGVVELRQKNWSEAAKYLRRALSAGDFDAERAVMLAQALYGAAFENQAPAVNKSELDEADALLDKALAVDAERKDIALSETALLARGQIARFRGELETAAGFFAEARQVRPDSARSAYMQALAWLERKQAEKALFVVDTFPSTKLTAQLMGMRARALLELGRSGDARSALDKAIVLNSGENAEDELTLVLAEISLDGGWPDLAESLFTKSPPAEAWLKDLFQARIELARGQSDEAEKLFHSAINSATPAVVAELRAEFAEFLRTSGRPKEATDQLELAGAETNPKLWGLYARALHEAQEFTKAAALLERVRTVDGPLPTWALALGTAISTLSDDVPAAIEYLSLWVERSPDNHEAALRLVHAHLRSRAPDKAVSLLDKLTASQDLAPRQLLGAAESYIRAGAPDRALPLAYRALRAEPDAADIQLAYVNIFLQREHDLPDSEPAEVVPGVHVILRAQNGTTSGYSVVAEGAAVGRLGELQPDDPLAAQLLGKKVGDRLVLRPGALSQTDAEVVEIKSGLVHAFQDILGNFQSRNPTSAALQPFKVPDEPTIEDLDFLVTSLKRDEESEREALALYDEHCLPLGLLARLLGGGIVDAYAAVAGRADKPMLVEFGDSLAQARDTAGSGTLAILTRSALVTASLVGILELVADVHPQLAVPQSLLDELQEERHKATLYLRDGFKGAVHREGQIGMNVVPPAEVRAMLERLDYIIDWVAKVCAVKARPLDTLTAGEADKMRERLGESSYDALALARSTNGELYADDLGLRRFAAADTGRLGFSSFAVLAAGLRGGRLEQVAFDRAVAELLRLNHASIPMAPTVLSTALADSHYRIDGATAPLFRRVRTAVGTPADLAVYCCGVIREVSLSEEGRGHLPALTFALAEAMAAGQGRDPTVALLRRAASHLLQLLPQANDTVQAALDRFETFSKKGSLLK